MTVDARYSGTGQPADAVEPGRAADRVRNGSHAGFLLRFALLVLAVVVVPWLIGLTEPTEWRRFLVPGSAALILASAYVRRPAEALLALAMIVLLYDSLALYIRGPYKQIDELTVAALVPLALAGSWRQWRAWVSWPRELAIALVVALGVGSSLLADVPPGVWIPALLLVGKAIAFFYVTMWSRIEEWEIAAGMRAVLIVGIPLVLLGLVEMLNPYGFQHLLGLNEYVRSRGESTVVKSLFTHPALFGYFTAFVALFLTAQYLTVRRWRWLALALFFSMGPFLSARRRAIVALVTGIGAALLESLRITRSLPQVIRTWLPVAAGNVVLAIVFLPMLTGLYQLTLDRYVTNIPGFGETPVPSASPAPGAVGSEDNPQARVALYVGSLEIARDYFPMGAGLGRYGSWMSRDPYSPLYEEYGLSTIRGLRPANPRSATDTFWPQILGETGAVGLIAYGGFLAALAWMLWKEAGRQDGPVLRVLRLGAGMIFAQAIMESVASSMFHSPPRTYLFFLVVGLVASIAWRREALERR